MNVDGKHFRTIWVKEGDPTVVQIIDQRPLPHEFVIEDLTTVEEMAAAIQEMHVRGAGLIGAAAGYGMYIAALHAPREFRRRPSRNQSLRQGSSSKPPGRPPSIWNGRSNASCGPWL